MADVKALVPPVVAAFLDVTKSCRALGGDNIFTLAMAAEVADRVGLGIFEGIERLEAIGMIEKGALANFRDKMSELSR